MTAISAVTLRARAPYRAMRGGYRKTGEREDSGHERGARPHRAAPGKVTRTMQLNGSVVAGRASGRGDEPFGMTASGGDAPLPEDLQGSFEESLGIRPADGGGGEPLPEAARGRLEAGLGVDLGGVRVHADANASAASDTLAARAFTRGQDVYFGAGEYDPGSDAGFHLLAHEVVHTVQQRGAAQEGPATKGRISQPEDAAEREADDVADRIAAGAATPIAVSAIPAPLARKRRTAADLDYPETSDWYMYEQARRNAENPVWGINGGSRSVSHADMLGLGYEFRGVDGNTRRYHMPGSHPDMIFWVIINPENDADAPDPNAPTTPADTDPRALREARAMVQEWSRLTKKTLPIYDRLRQLRGQGQGDAPEYDQLIDQANNLFDQAKEWETEFQNELPYWREKLANDPDARSELDGISTGDVDGLRTWVDDFDQNRDADGNRRSDEKWKQAEEEAKKRLEELENPPEEAPDEEYDDEGYDDEGYDDEAYDEAYDDEAYDDEEYDDEAYEDE